MVQRTGDLLIEGLDHRGASVSRPEIPVFEIITHETCSLCGGVATSLDTPAYVYCYECEAVSGFVSPEERAAVDPMSEDSDGVARWVGEGGTTLADPA